MTADEIRAQLTAAIRSDRQAAAILKKIAAGRANFSDTMNYSLISGRLTGQQLAEVILGLSEGREELAVSLLRDRYDDINAQCAAVQRTLDEKQGLHLAPQKSDFPKERAAKFAHSLIDPTVTDETIKRRARNVSENITVTFHDDCIKANAEFRDRAGLKCFVERVTVGDCCPWCTAMAGKYLMSEQPEGLFRRHDKCDCMIIYDGKVLRGQLGENGRRGRRWAEQPPKVEYTPPKRFSRSEAERIQAEHMPKRLTGGADGGIIRSIDVDDYKLITGGKGIAPEVNNTILDTMKKCEKEGKFVISEISTEVVPTSYGTPILQIVPTDKGLLQLNINAEYLSGKTLEEINSAFTGTESNLANSLEEAVIHESGHAISIKGKRPNEVEDLYAELLELGKPGISVIARDDGAECLAELEILRHRGTKVSKELSDFYEKYMGRKF